MIKDIFAGYWNGKIYAKGKLAYLHEYRHSKQPVKLFILYSYWLLIAITVFAIASFYTMNYLTMFLSVPPLVMIIIMEIDAWVYSIKNYNNTNIPITKETDKQ